MAASASTTAPITNQRLRREPSTTTKVSDEGALFPGHIQNHLPKILKSRDRNDSCVTAIRHRPQQLNLALSSGPAIAISFSTNGGTCSARVRWRMD